MGCCDRARRAAPRSATTAPASPDADVSGSRLARPLRLHYLGQPAIEVRGAASGRTYRFDARTRTQSIDPSDVNGLLRTRLFRRA
jgi:hypothetical protein